MTPSSLLHWEISQHPNGKAQFSWEVRGGPQSECYQRLHWLVCQDWCPKQCELGLFRKGINLTLFRWKYQRGSKGIRQKKKSRKLETVEFEFKAGHVALSGPRPWRPIPPRSPWYSGLFYLLLLFIFALWGTISSWNKTWAVMGCPQYASPLVPVMKQCPWTSTCFHVWWGKSQSL